LKQTQKCGWTNRQQGTLDVGTTKIDDGAINRSLWAYLQNPESERAQYNETTDKTLTLLRFKRSSDSRDVGVLTWFSVHGTSMYGNNTHAAADNKGVAAWMFEESVQGDDGVADGFVAGFSQGSVGDTTPNVLGAWCDDGSGKMCTLKNSTCSGTSEACHGRGPEFQALDLGVSSCHEMGRRQYAGARSVYVSRFYLSFSTDIAMVTEPLPQDSLATTSTPVTGTTVKSFHFFHDMRYWNFTTLNGTAAQTCPAALGYSFAAGTTDWPGAFDFTQNDTGKPDANPLWIAVRDLIKDPTPQQKACQQPKPVLLDVGELSEPYPWAPNIVDVMSMRVGNLFIIASPSEVTTMSGRRWRDAVAQEGANFIDDPMVVLTSPANTYAHYLATPEEYVAQRYEGASTLFGQHELDAYINLTIDNMHYLHPDSTDTPDQGTLPPNDVGVSLSFIPGVVADNPPIGKSFGDVLVQPNASYPVGAVVNATFQGADPRNNLRLDQTYAAIEQQTTSGGPWTQVKDDTDWFLVYTWRRTNVVLGYSEVDISWETYGNAVPGTYRVRYYGDSKSLLTGKVSAFDGASNIFQLTSS
jgi:neutral ceramidase